MLFFIYFFGRAKFNKNFSKKKDSRNRKPPEKNFKKGKNNKMKFQGKSNRGKSETGAKKKQKGKR